MPGGLNCRALSYMDGVIKMENFMSDRPIAIYHEHPDWFRPLFKELEQRGIPYERVDASSHSYDPGENSSPWSLVVNRASPSAHLRGNVQSTFHTLHWVRHLESIGTPVINGARAYEFELSKASQLSLLHGLGVPAPKTRVINDAGQAVGAAEKLRYPILLKENVGGSGAGIVRYDTPEELVAAITRGLVEPGVDGTLLVQELSPLRDGHITRVETLNGKYLYAIKVFPAKGSFDLCPADVCQTTGGVELVRGACAIDAPQSGLKVEAFTPSAEIIQQVERIVQAAGIDIGGVEYLVDDRDGKPYFYDINALSNFVADPVNVIGFDPFVNFVDYIEAKIESASAVSVDTPLERVA